MQSLLIDTNILVLLVIGSFDREAIPTHRRTAVFAPRDFDLLQSELARYGRVLTTHGVLTEASNLMGNTFHEAVARTLISICSPLVEVLSPKETIFSESSFPRLGFADASILVALDDDTAVLTDDVGLYTQALYLGREAINFNHLRRFGDA